MQQDNNKAVRLVGQPQKVNPLVTAQMTRILSAHKGVEEKLLADEEKEALRKSLTPLQRKLWDATPYSGNEIINAVRTLKDATLSDDEIEFVVMQCNESDSINGGGSQFLASVVHIINNGSKEGNSKEFVAKLKEAAREGREKSQGNRAQRRLNMPANKRKARPVKSTKGNNLK